MEFSFYHHRRTCSAWSASLLLTVLLFHICVQAQTNSRRSRQTLTYMVWEESDINTSIGNLKVDARLNRDYNETIMGSLTFSFFDKSEHAHFFNLDAVSSDLSVAEKIDRDKLCPGADVCQLTLDVAVKPIEHFRIIKLVIEIQDLNDNRPRFTQSHTTHSISESTPQGVLFPLHPAVDPDSPSYGIKHYELQPLSDTFELRVRNNSDGTVDLQLYLRGSVDREVQDFYQLNVVAYDGGVTRLSGTQIIDIVITDVNDNSPQFVEDSYDVEVMETAQVCYSSCIPSSPVCK